MAKKGKLDLNEGQLKMIENMAGYRMPLTKIAVILGVSRSHFINHANKEGTPINQAVQRGHAKSTLSVTKMGFSMATSGKHPDMTRFWLQSQEGWKPTEAVEHKGDGGGPIATTDMTAEERRKEIQRLMDLRKKEFGE